MAEITRIIDPGQNTNQTTRPTAETIGRSQLVSAQQEDDAWNVAAVDKSSNIALSNSDKTATLTSTSSGAVRSKQKNNGGPYYAEFHITTTGSIVLVGLKLGTAILADVATAFYINVAGDIINYGATVGSVGGALATGDVVSLAWNNGHAWARKNNGLWNNDAAADPATATNGLPCTPVNSVALWFTSATTVNTSVTVRTELAEFTQSVPAGFASWMGEAPAGVDGDATGATLTATASLVSGTATSAVDGNASGGTIIATAALAVGAAIGGAAASGATVTDTVAAVPGTATGTAIAAGSTLADAASLASGTAAGTATQAGTIQSVTATVSGGTGAGATTASGTILAATTAFVAGTASGSAVLNGNASGSTVTLGASLGTGAATGAAATSGATLTVTATPLTGTAAGQASGTGSLLTASTSLIAGSASGTGAGEVIAQGAILEASTSLIAGTAAGTSEVTIVFGGRRGRPSQREDAVVDGQTLTCFARIVAGQTSTVSLFAGAAFGDAVAANDNLEATAQILPGTATGERNFADDELLMIFAEAA